MAPEQLDRDLLHEIFEHCLENRAKSKRYGHTSMKYVKYSSLQLLDKRCQNSFWNLVLKDLIYLTVDEKTGVHSLLSKIHPNDPAEKFNLSEKLLISLLKRNYIRRLDELTVENSTDTPIGRIVDILTLIHESGIRSIGTIKLHFSRKSPEYLSLTANLIQRYRPREISVLSDVFTYLTCDMNLCEVELIDEIKDIQLVDHIRSMNIQKLIFSAKVDEAIRDFLATLPIKEIVFTSTGCDDFDYQPSRNLNQHAKLLNLVYKPKLLIFEEILRIASIARTFTSLDSCVIELHQTQRIEAREERSHLEQFGRLKCHHKEFFNNTVLTLDHITNWFQSAHLLRANLTLRIVFEFMIDPSDGRKSRFSYEYLVRFRSVRLRIRSSIQDDWSAMMARYNYPRYEHNLKLYMLTVLNRYLAMIWVRKPDSKPISNIDSDRTESLTSS